MINSKPSLMCLASLLFLGACGGGSTRLEPAVQNPIPCITPVGRAPIHFKVESEEKVAMVRTLAGVGTLGSSGDGGSALAAEFNTPGIVAWAVGEDAYLTDVFNHTVRRIDGVTGIVSTVAGSGADGFSGDGEAATGASLSRPREVVVDQDDNLFFVDLQNHRVRRVDAVTGVITTVAGNGVEGPGEGDGKSLGTYNGDDQIATAAGLSRPHALVLAANGDLYISDTRNHRVRVVDAQTCMIRTIAGTGTKGYNGDGGAAVDARLSRPHAGALDPQGNFYFADLDNNVVRRVDAGTGVITTIAGIGANQHSGDGGLATLAGLKSPRGIAVDIDDNIYIATFDGNRVRRIDAVTGIITTIAGTGALGYSGDDGPALEASFAHPQGLTISPQGTLILADWSNYRVREIYFVDPD